MGQTTPRAAYANEILTIDLSQPGHMNMLVWAYNNIYIPCFPNKAHREPLEHWIERLQGNPPTPDRYVVILAGENLDNPAIAKIKGISVGIYYEAAEAGLMAYNAIHKDYQGQGLGRLLLEARQEALEGIAALKGRSLKGLFAEAQDPKKPGKNDIFDPTKRIETFARWGAEIVPIHYVQPALALAEGEENKGKSKNLLLLSYPTREFGHATPSITQAFVHALYTADGESLPEEDRHYCRMFTELEMMKPVVDINSARLLKYSHG